MSELPTLPGHSLELLREFALRRIRAEEALKAAKEGLVDAEIAVTIEAIRRVIARECSPYLALYLEPCDLGAVPRTFDQFSVRAQLPDHPQAIELRVRLSETGWEVTQHINRMGGRGLYAVKDYWQLTDDLGQALVWAGEAREGEF